MLPVLARALPCLCSDVEPWTIHVAFVLSHGICRLFLVGAGCRCDVGFRALDDPWLRLRLQRKRKQIRVEFQTNTDPATDIRIFIATGNIRRRFDPSVRHAFGMRCTACAACRCISRMFCLRFNRPCCSQDLACAGSKELVHSRSTPADSASRRRHTISSAEHA